MSNLIRGAITCKGPLARLTTDTQEVEHLRVLERFMRQI